MADPQTKPQMVLCVPGPWRNRTELVERIVRDSDGYLFAGRVLLNMGTHFSCELAHENPDPRMPRAFSAAGPHWRDTSEMEALASHASVVYLIGEGGSRESAENLMKCGAALLKAGGLGVKVESTGLAHKPNDWIEFCDGLPFFAAHRALVVYLAGSEVNSCGMHNLGLRDAIAHCGSDPAAAVELVRTFTRYLFAETPSIRSGQTFSVASDAPVYRIEDHPGWDYGTDSLFTNPYGAWRLVPVSPR